MSELWPRYQEQLLQGWIPVQGWANPAAISLLSCILQLGNSNLPRCRERAVTHTLPGYKPSQHELTYRLPPLFPQSLPLLSSVVICHTVYYGQVPLSNLWLSCPRCDPLLMITVWSWLQNHVLQDFQCTLSSRIVLLMSNDTALFFLFWNWRSALPW